MLEQQGVILTLRLKKVNIDLNPEPSNFKGGNRPVELLSEFKLWHVLHNFCWNHS